VSDQAWQELWRITAEQDGVASVEQAVAAGLSPAQLKWARRTGRLVTVRRGVVAAPGTPVTKRRSIRAAVLAVDGSAGSHSSAGTLLHMPWTGDDRIHLASLARTACTAVGVVLHRVSFLPEEHLTVVDGIPVTNRARTIVDLAATMRLARWEHLLDEELAAHAGLIEEIEAVAELWCRRGRTGSTRVREALATRLGGPAIGPTALERMLIDLLRGAGLPLPTLQANLDFLERHDARVDGVYLDQRIVLEADSRRWHTRVADFERDRLRDQLAAAHGWRVLRFTWRQITEEPDAVVDIIRRTLERPPGFSPGN
jgi:hypothetical protein